MPYRSATPCRYPSCRALAANIGYCIEHSKEIKRQIDDRRGSPAERGYDTRWIKYRMLFLARHPFCNGRFKDGSMCNHPANEVDHIQRVAGPDDPLFWDEDNHQALCKACHSRKTAREVFKGK